MDLTRHLCVQPATSQMTTLARVLRRNQVGENARAIESSIEAPLVAETNAAGRVARVRKQPANAAGERNGTGPES